MEIDNSKKFIISNITSDEIHCDKATLKWKSRNKSIDDKIQEINSQLDNLEMTPRNSVRIQALNNAKESLAIPMPSPKTKEIIGKILNKPEEVAPKKKRGRPPKNKEVSNDVVTTNEKTDNNKSPERGYLLRLQNRKN